MKILGNVAVFVILYVLFMIPTYILPYFGSNSPSTLSFWASEGYLFQAPQFLMHVGALIILIVVTWFRGVLVEKKWLIIFPILASLFDFVPPLNYIPLVPTVMHLLAIILGVVDKKAPAPTTGVST